MLTAAVLHLLVAFGAIHEALAMPAQVPMQVETRRPRKLHGRFLHLTDMHPDPFYRTGTSEKSACHRKKPKKEKPRAGEFGYLYGECDSPMILTNYTLDYLDQNWADEVDFVIWTGDSARHDNDRKLPRTLKEIYALNRAMASRMEEIFTRRGVPVIPSMGNNDVWPHNIMLPGPNDVTFEFSSIWKSFVPFHSYQVFQRGAYYSVEVIPDAVAVISLNTMYLFDSNKAVGGCDPKDSEDPGNLQMDWMEVQLETFRRKGMQVYVSGHVPPSARNYHPECHVRYVELSLRYQDTILGHLFGHMNADHFFLLDASDVRRTHSADSLSNVSASESDVSTLGKHKELYTTLLKDFNQVAKKSDKKKLDYDALAVVNVSPSVVPNPYLPSFRIFAYNHTGEAYQPHSKEESMAISEHRFIEEAVDDDDEYSDEMEAETAASAEDPESDTFASSRSMTGTGRHLGNYIDRESWCPVGKENGSWACLLKERWHSSPRSPSRTNRLYTPLGFAQYYLPDMNGTAKHPPKWKLEYLTFEPSKLHPPRAKALAEAGGDATTTWRPIPLKQLPKSLRNATATKSKYAPYKMADLTIPSWLRLVRRLGKAKHGKLRQRFRRYMYMGANEEL